MQEPIISIICNTYNQEKYIADALNSFLMQAVSVPFEILVHDDASTDGTADVIRVYEQRFPEIVKPIYQTENQYSKGVSITAEIQIPRAKGKYIAFCEGDDYWTGPQKLQKQYDFMEAHPQASACCHAYSMVDKEKNLIEERLDFQQDCIVPMKKLIGDQLKVPHFATIVVRGDIIKEFQACFLGVRSNDMILRVFCATKGDVYYMNQNMSCYRRFTEGSWTMRVGKNKENMIAQLKKYIPFLGALDEYTQGKYAEDIKQVMDERLFAIDLLENNYKAARKRKAFKNASWKRKVYIILGSVFPKLITKIREKRAS